jgi:hypothetical protein
MLNNCRQEEKTTDFTDIESLAVTTNPSYRTVQTGTGEIYSYYSVGNGVTTRTLSSPDVGEAVAFRAGDGGRFVTGQIRRKGYPHRFGESRVYAGIKDFRQELDLAKISSTRRGITSGFKPSSRSRDCPCQGMDSTLRPASRVYWKGPTSGTGGRTKVPISNNSASPEWSKRSRRDCPCQGVDSTLRPAFRVYWKVPQVGLVVEPRFPSPTTALRPNSRSAAVGIRTPNLLIRSQIYYSVVDFGG